MLPYGPRLVLNASVNTIFCKQIGRVCHRLCVLACTGKGQGFLLASRIVRNLTEGARALQSRCCLPARSNTRISHLEFESIARWVQEKLGGGTTVVVQSRPFRRRAGNECDMQFHSSKMGRAPAQRSQFGSRQRPHPLRFEQVTHHSPLLSRHALKAQVWLDDKLDSSLTQPRGQCMKLVDAQRRATVGHGHSVAIHRVVVRSGVVAGNQVRHQLMPVEVPIHPRRGRPPFSAALRGRSDCQGFGACRVRVRWRARAAGAPRVRPP